jgi:phosphoglycerate dehydrogenase-like enzyme
LLILNDINSYDLDLDFILFNWIYGYNYETKFNKVVVIGLGQLGLPVAKYVKEKGFDTFGYDINHKAMEIDDDYRE